MHANKLKRKLADLGVDGNNPRLTESFCLIGTPLPPLEKSKDTGEFVPLWKQDVRDEKGRRRLHGAFTGGFSAGYYNTVGSAEGWAPSTFISSRSDRATKKKARPEDFMDDEDLEEMKESQKLVDTNEEMDLSHSHSTEPDSMAAALEGLIPSARDSIGARLLKKMGWKPGHGIGPKITYQQLQEQDLQSASRTGYAQGATSQKGKDLDEEAAKHLYPPRDTKLVSYSRKENSFGLGFSPGDRLDSGTSGSKDEAGNPSRISAGFGLGALNDAEDDDLDVYDNSHDQPPRRYMAFDGEEDEAQVAKSAQEKTGRTAATQMSSADHFLGGGLVLPGFVLASQNDIDDQWFDPLLPPEGWVPKPKDVWTNCAAGGETGQNSSTTNRLPGNRIVLTSSQRGSTLGETPLPAAPKSVFDYLNPKDRDRLLNLSVNSLTTPSAPSSSTLQESSLSQPTIPRLDQAIAKAALSGFKPFQTDPGKSERYTQYLQSQLGDEDPASVLRPAPGQPSEIFYQELREFSESAKIFKPATGVLGGRFATAKVVESLDSGKEGLYMPELVEGQSLLDPSQRPAAAEKKEDPKVLAAREGMFGPLTREVKEWSPAKLLCKRFGVKEPVSDVVLEVVLAAGENDWKAQLPSQEQIQAAGLSSGVSNDVMQAASSSFRSRPNDLSNVGLGDDDGQGADILSYTKPERDIFKAIFESGSEDESMSEAEEPVPTVARQTNGLQFAARSDTVAEVDHPNAAASTPDSYVPGVQAGSTDTSQVMDMSTFRPSFNLKTRPITDKKKDKKKGKDSLRGKAILSFGDDEDGLQVTPAKPEKKKRKDKDKKREAKSHLVPASTHDEDEEMWVEKPAPSLAQGFDSANRDRPADLPHPRVPKEAETTPLRSNNRMRASDFM